MFLEILLKSGGRMRWIRFNSKVEKQRWHRWFAWHPVVIGKYPDGTKKLVWRETIERCGIYDNSYPGDEYWIWRYREVKNERM